MTKVSLKELRSYVHRVNPEEHQKSYGRIFFRPISIYWTWICLNLNISANQITVAQLLAGLIAIAAVACPKLWVGIVGLFLFQVGYMLDQVDGEIARFRKQASLTGRFLEEIGHQIVIPLMFLGFGVGDFLRHERWEVILFAALAGLFHLRIHILSKAKVVLDFAQSDLDSRFDYYKKFPDKSPAGMTVNTRGLIWTLYQLLSYPATLNTLSIFWLLDRFAGTENIIFGKTGLVYLMIILCGIMIPISRALTIRSVAVSSQVEKNFLELKEKMSTKKQPERSNISNPL